MTLQTHNDSTSRPLLFQLYDPEFSKLSDYDCIVQFVFRNMEDFLRMKADPRFLEKVAPDHKNFADTSRSTWVIFFSIPILKYESLMKGRWQSHGYSMTIGYFEEFLDNGELVPK